MKKYTTILFLLISINLFSQDFYSTSEEEYNYLTKGYRIQLESGLDMKKGYTFLNSYTEKVDLYNFEFKYLKKDDINKIIGTMVIAKSNVSGFTYYFCIPINNDVLFEKFYSSVNSLDERMTTALLIATTRILNREVKRKN